LGLGRADGGEDVLAVTMGGVAWVRVVIVNHNSGLLLGETLAALAGQTDGDFEAVIVDNASTDGSAAVRLPDCRFRVVESGKNLGFAAGCNLGSRDARTPWLAMLNPDAIPEPGWLASLAGAVRTYPGVAAFGSTQLDAENPEILDGAGDNYSIYGLAWRGGHGSPAGAVRGDARVFSACAAAALYRRDVFEAAGGFAETFFCYLEDVDLGFRLNLLGHEAIQLAEARVRHVGSACSGGKTSRFALYHGLRNSVFVCVRCMPFPLVLAALPLLVVSQVWIGVRVGQLKFRMEAVRDGLACLPRLLGERREIQAKRRMGAGEVARLVVWSARTVNRLRIVSLRRCQNPH
jgi:N-acetylglucosaminyl-diphospho-decaprenol L-rhamnosyltransferase